MTDTKSHGEYFNLKKSKKKGVNQSSK